MTPEEFFAILGAEPPSEAVAYRLYHDQQGRVLFYSMEDLPGSWIAVDAETYALASHQVRVVAGQLVPIPSAAAIDKLRPGKQGVCCDPRDICLIVDESLPHVKWSAISDEQS